MKDQCSQFVTVFSNDVLLALVYTFTALFNRIFQMMLLNSCVPFNSWKVCCFELGESFGIRLPQPYISSCFHQLVMIPFHVCISPFDSLNSTLLYHDLNLSTLVLCQSFYVYNVGKCGAIGAPWYVCLTASNYSLPVFP